MSTLQALRNSLEKIVLDPQYKAPLTLVKAIRNGAVYGTKVRFPHALVMIFLFRSGTIREKIALVLKATRQHASNLARFALLYKTGMMLLRRANGGKEAPLHSFLSGLHGGYWVFGHGKGASSSVNQQIVIYVFARVILGLAKLAIQPPGDNALVGSQYGGHGGKGFLRLTEEQRALVQKYSWPVFASLSWASVMWLFEGYPETLQPSLRSSMTYIFANSDHWHSLDSFIWQYNRPVLPGPAGLNT
ncbi:Peroxisomal membrane protein 4 [Cercospora zeina]